MAVYLDVKNPLEPGKNSSVNSLKQLLRTRMTTQIKSATGNIGTFDKDNPNIRFSKKRDVATSKKKDYNKRSYYSEFDSLTMRWRNKADTEIGDRKVISRGEGIFSLLKATEDGYIELATGNWTKIKELKAEHERAYEEATDEIYGNYESYGADEGRDIWNMFLSEDRTDGFRNTGEIGTRGVQTNSSGSDEHSRGSHREKSVNTPSKILTIESTDAILIHTTIFNRGDILNKKKLYILTYDHGGFVLWGDRVKSRLKALAEWMEKYPKLRIGLDYESFTFDEFMRQDPEIIQMISELLKKYPERFGLGATTYGQPLSLFISEESNVRQLTYAVRTNLKYFGKTPSVYAISEFALNNQTPQLISQCGYEAAILRSHVMGYGYTKTFDSPWGRWIGKDLTEIPAVPTYHKQGRGFNCTTVDNWILSRWPVDSELYSLENFEKMFSDYEPLLASRYDDLTQPIEEVTAHTQNVENYEYVLLEDIPGIFGEAKDELKTTDNDFHAQMPWGYCGNEIFNGCRQGEVDALQGEKLNAFSVMLGGDSLQTTSEEAWKYILAAQHHDVTICGLLDLSRRFIPESLRLSDKVKTESFSALSAKFASNNGDSLLVVNPHSFDIDEWIEIPVEYSCCAYDGDTALECENINSNGNNVLRAHVCLPPLTVKRYELKKSDPFADNNFFYDADSGVLTTPIYKVKFTEKGIAYIDSVADSCRVYDNGDGALFSAFIENEECASSGKWNINVTANGATAVQEGMIGSIPYSFEMNFAGKRTRIDCKARFEMHGEHVGRTDITQGRPVPLTRNGHHHEDKLCFVMNLCLDNNRRMVRDLPFAVSDWNGALLKPEEYWYPDDKILIDTEVTQEESFNSTTYMQGVYWLGLRDGKKGIAVFNKGCMGSAISGNTVHIPLLYSNLYMCGTRILDGVFEDEFALMPFNASVSDIDIHKASIAYNYPPISGVIAKGDGGLCEFSAAKLNTKGTDVILTALYPEDGAMLARFCNFSDNSASVEFAPTVGCITAQTDLLGNETEKITGNELHFRPWEIKTVKIEEV